MVDIHHHLLPEIDDGSPNLETSVKMARIAVEDGITHIVCTPHASNQFLFSPAIVAAKLQQLREVLASEGVPVRLGSGCDFHLNYDNVEDARENPLRYTVNGGKYLLVELPDYGLSPNVSETFYDLQLSGLTLILTHPERNPTLQKDLSKIGQWIANGVLIQVTAMSVLGRMGKAAKNVSQTLLKNRWVHFLASDAHNSTSRPPRMKEAYDAISKKYGEAYAEQLCRDNPLAVFENRPLMVQEDLKHLENVHGNRRPSRWWNPFD